MSNFILGLAAGLIISRIIVNYARRLRVLRQREGKP